MEDSCVRLPSIQGVEANQAELLQRITGFTGNIAFDPSKPAGVPCRHLDCSRASELGWRAKISLEEGLASTYEWFCRQHQNELRLGSWRILALGCLLFRALKQIKPSFCGKRITGFTGNIAFDPSKPTGVPRRNLDCCARLPSIQGVEANQAELLQRIPGQRTRLAGRTKISLEEGLASTYEWFCRQHQDELRLGSWRILALGCLLFRALKQIKPSFCNASPALPVTSPLIHPSLREYRAATSTAPGRASKLGWRAKISLEEGLASTYEWFCRQHQDELRLGSWRILALGCFLFRALKQIKKP